MNALPYITMHICLENENNFNLFIDQLRALKGQQDECTIITHNEHTLVHNRERVVHV